MGLKAIESKLPPGFRFCPSDEELVFHYLYKKVTNQRVSKGTLMDVDLHTCEPSQLPDAAKLNETEWYFFSFRDRKYSTGFRTNRATREGYWKATGKDRAVHEPSRRPLVGMRKTLVFYRGRAPNGAKSGWVMHEFRLENPYEPPKEDFVLCRVFHKMKLGVHTARYGGLENEQNNNNVAGTFSSLSMASPFPPLRIDGGIAEGCGQQLAINSPHVPAHHQGQEGTCSANGLLNTAVWHYGFLDLTQETNSHTIDGGGEEYRYFLDMDQDPEDHDLLHEQLGRNESVP